MATQTIKEQLEILVQSIPVIKEDRNYWFVRTDGGDYYEHFIKGSYIGIGHNEITLADIRMAEGEDNYQGLESLIDVVKNRYPNLTRVGLTANQLVRFAYQIKKGDIVLIPSYSSDYFYFGEVTSSVVELSNGSDGCPHKKRKRIKWIKQYRRNEIDSELTKVIYTHQTITDARQYDWIIDRLLNDLFIKGKETHLVIKVGQKGSITADTFFDFGELFKLTKEFCNESEIPYDENTKIKSKVQSEGIIECIKTITQEQAITGPIGVLALGLILVSLAGGKFSLKVKYNQEQGFSLDAESGVPVGILERIGRFINDRADNKLRAKMLDKALEKMEIKDPEDLIKLLEKPKKED